MLVPRLNVICGDFPTQSALSGTIKRTPSLVLHDFHDWNRGVVICSYETNEWSWYHSFSVED